MATDLRDRLASAMLPVPPGAERDPDALRLLPPREYSAASVVADGTLELVVRQVRGADGGLGIGSGWLTRHMEVGGTTALRVRPNPGFRMPAATGPLILIGNGTGIAGLRAHLKEQAHAGTRGHWLLFGERSRAHESFFEDELAAWQADGTLARLDRAFSRDAECGRYVQALLADAGDDFEAFLDAGATILVCGSLEGMAQEVHAAIVDLIGETRLTHLAEDGRYRRDVY